MKKSLFIALTLGLTTMLLTGCSNAIQNDQIINPENNLDQTTQINSLNSEENLPPKTQQIQFVEIISPDLSQPVKSPIKIIGKMPGTFFFEGTFPVILKDANGKQIAKANAKATGDWMTAEKVEFTADLSFVQPETETGKIIFQKDNPSGLAENASEESFNVIFLAK